MPVRHQSPALLKSRWAAIGAAVAVSLGAGGFGLIHATNPAGASAFVPISPCRALDTRTDFQVGPRSSPLGANDTYDVSGHGTVGDCTLPDDATGLALNVTALDATAPSFLTFYPAGAVRPDASHLNPGPGQPPTPNAVNVQLGADGRFSIYNFQGSVNVIADVVGYYTGHDHDDRYYTKEQSDAALATKANTADVYTKGQADEQFMTQPMGALIVPLASFIAVDDEWLFTFAWSREATTSATCISAPVELPTGASIDSIDLSYGRSPAPTTTAPLDLEVQVGVMTIASEPGAYPGTQSIQNHFVGEADLAVTGPDSIARVNLPHDQAAADGIGWGAKGPVVATGVPTIAVCAEDYLTLTGVTINFTMP